MMNSSNEHRGELNIAVYVSGHGFGHASRICEVINALAERRPGLFFYVRTSAPQWFFEQSLSSSVKFHYHYRIVDIGVVQENALELEKKKTLEAFRDFWLNRNAIMESESDFFKCRRLSLVLADIPPLAFDIATSLSVPAIGITNFSWDWIYRDYAALFPEFEYLLGVIREAYGRATLLLRLPFHGDLSAFRTIRDISLVARKCSREPEEVKKRFAIPAGLPMVLLSFGGIGVNFHSLEKAASFGGYQFVSTFPARGESSHFAHIREVEFLDSGFTYPDLVNAAAAVIGKPGYGLVSECIAHGTPLIYTSRGDFAEYDILVEGIKKHLRAAFIPQHDLFGGNWNDYIQDVLTSSFIPEAMAADGADCAAQKIEAFLVKSGH
jgi:hypothetical protein